MNELFLLYSTTWINLQINGAGWKEVSLSSAKSTLYRLICRRTEQTSADHLKADHCHLNSAEYCKRHEETSGEMGMFINTLLIDSFVDVYICQNLSNCQLYMSVV